ncbi:MAG TPA: PQQ-binding-like beta-propeller repeat protein [Balneolales bacterium]|nr:PQQ-binding-like beta-propeller repeat protein [Balneolales bacterium]
MRNILKSALYICVILSNTFSQSYGQSTSKDLIWKYKTKGKIIGTAAIQNHIVYFGSSDGVIHALHEKNGTPVWNFKTKGEIASRPEVSNGLLYILSGDGNFYAINVETGKMAWKFKTGGEHRFIRHSSSGKTYSDIWDYYLSSAVVDNGTVYFGSSDGNIYSLNARTGKLKWKYKTGNVVHASPVLKGHKLYLGSFDGNMYALNALNGKLIWKFKTIGERYFPNGAIQRGAAFYKGGVYFGSRDFNLYVLNSENGRGLWNYREKGSWIIATPTIYNGQIYFGTSDSHAFYSFNAETGKMNWKLNLNMRVYGSTVGYGDNVFFGCFNGYLYGVNTKTGHIDWRFQTDGSHENYQNIYRKDGSFQPGFHIYGKTLQATRENEEKIQSMGSIMATPIIQNRILFFGSTDSTFYAVKLPDQ